jgi:hypothetical protein
MRCSANKVMQQSVAKLNENGTTTNFRKKDQVASEEKALHPFRKFFDEFCCKMYLTVTGSQCKTVILSTVCQICLFQPPSKMLK